MDIDWSFFVFRHKCFLTNAFFWSKKHSDEKYFFWEKNILFYLSRRWAMSETFLTFCQKTLCVVIKTALYLSFRKIWQFFSKKFFFPIISGHWAIFFDFLLESFRRGCENCILRVHRNTLKESKVFRKKYSSLSSSDTEAKKSDFLLNCSGEFVKTVFYVSLGPFWRQVHF